MVNRLRIAHVTATFPPYPGGTGNVCYHNARELVRRGHETHVFTVAQPNTPMNEVSAGIQIQRFRPALRYGNAGLLPQLLTELRGFDVIHLHYPFFGGEMAAVAAILDRTPLVVTYHQDVFLKGIIGIIENVIRVSVGRFTLRTADRVLFTSEDYGDVSYVRPLLHGRDHMIGELPNGVDTQFFASRAPSVELRRRCGIQNGDTTVLLVATLDRAHYFKGVHEFLRALAQVSCTVKGVIVGDGDLRASYEALAASLSISPRLTFAGRVSNEKLRQYYCLADVTVLPSKTMGEAFGLVLLESLASGTPVIASNLPGVRTVVTDGEDGFLVKPGNVDDLSDKLKRIQRLSHAQRKAMGQAGRRKIEQKYTWEHIGSRLEAIYASILSNQATVSSVSQRQEAS